MDTEELNAALPAHGAHDAASMAAARAAIGARLAVADTDDALSAPRPGSRGANNARLLAAARRLLVAKAMQPRLGAASLFQQLSCDLVTSLALDYLPAPPALDGEWRVAGAFHHGEQYEYRMRLTEHADGTVTGTGSFGDQGTSPTFRVTRGLVVLCPDPGSVGGSAVRPVLHMRQEALDFINFCSCVLSPDRRTMTAGEWLQLDVTAAITQAIPTNGSPRSVFWVFSGCSLGVL